MERIWNLVRPPVAFESYNVAPTQLVPIVRSCDGGRECVLARWGLIPAWSKDRRIGYKTFNARAETAATKPVFRAAFKRRHCVLPVEGFYEWKRTGNSKQPMFIHSSDGGALKLAGLWDRWVDSSSGEVVDSATILTTEANRYMEAIHNRMPVILDAAGSEAWLRVADTQFTDKKNAGSTVQGLLCPCAEGMLDAYPVSTRVNNARNDDPSNIEPIAVSVPTS